MSHSFGLEDELSFGSDEDLMETIGEIEVPQEERPVARSPANATLPPPVSSSSTKPPKATKSSRSFIRSRKESTSGGSRTSLASTTHLLPPLPPVPSGSQLDLPADMYSERDKTGQKRGSIMGALKVRGLRKWRDDQSSRNSFVTDSQSMSSTLSLSKIGSNTCEWHLGLSTSLMPASRPSLSSSMAYTPVGGPSPSSTVPHLGPLSLPSFDSTSERGFNIGHQEVKEAAGYDEPHVALRNMALGGGQTTSSGATTPSITTVTSPTSSIIPNESWTPRDISSAILPAFPSTLASLEPITVFSAEAFKRPSSTARSPSQSRWSPCTLVFTLFKVSVNTEDASEIGGTTERTVAHVHVYSKAPSHIALGGSTGIRRAKSNAGFNVESTSGRVEIERRLLSRSTTASICDDHTDADGRTVVMQILWGDEDGTKSSEWLIEMKDATQLHEWIRQIKKTSIMINAEGLGYGRAIRPAFETSAVSADDLAHQLSVHARAVAAEASVGVLPSPASQEETRRLSLDATQGAALARSHSADAVETRSGTLGRAHRKAGSEEKVQTPAMSELDWFGTSNDNALGGLSLGGFNLGGTLAFPAPPSDLPPPRPLRTAASKNKVVSNALAMSSTPVLPTMVNASAAAFDDPEVLDDLSVRPPTPPRRGASKDDRSLQLHLLQSRGKAPSIASTTTSATSTTSRLRRLRGKPQVIDISECFECGQS